MRVCPSPSTRSRRRSGVVNGCAAHVAPPRGRVRRANYSICSELSTPLSLFSNLRHAPEGVSQRSIVVRMPERRMITLAVRSSFWPGPTSCISLLMKVTQSRPLTVSFLRSDVESPSVSSRMRAIHSSYDVRQSGSLLGSPTRTVSIGSSSVGCVGRPIGAYTRMRSETRDSMILPLGSMLKLSLSASLWYRSLSSSDVAVKLTDSQMLASVSAVVTTEPECFGLHTTTALPFWATRIVVP
mmetsp:Transcript_28476/g.88257  ORF Transcript_28476/g.88257 Transcript_28476/m.88257 type:complete len:241 (-) Transcript_28476:964-1686(-)